ncbi:MAG: trehalose-6-phosphate synthase [Actinomycetota bacterium]
MFVVSNRGPFRFTTEADGTVTTRPGGGGVSSALRPLLTDPGVDAHWIAAAMTADERAAVRSGAVHVPDLDLVLLDLDPEQARLHYDIVSNQTLWFLHHGMFDLAHRPTFDPRFRDAWQAYTAVNRAFADAVVERATAGDAVLVQDYQLALVPGLVTAARPDLRVGFFTHTPFCGPNSIRVLPTDIAETVLRSMRSVPCGFHTARWARAYTASARELLGADPPPRAYAASLGPDAVHLAEVAASDAARAALRELDAVVGDRRMLLRIDRVEPSKNIVRGFAAYDHLLERHPEWRANVVFVALLNPSRESLPEYLAYGDEVVQAAEAVNARWGSADWQPVVLDTRDDFAGSIAALGRYDVLLVNPIKDGLNLVAKEGPLCNQRDGVLCLSPEAGAFDELGPAALAVHPWDVEQSAEQLHAALVMPSEARAARAEWLRRLAGARTPRHWLDDQLAALS